MSRLVRVAGNTFYRAGNLLYDVPSAEVVTLIAFGRGIECIQRGLLVRNEYSETYLREYEPFELDMPEVVELWTNAPEQYDGFGTATLYTSKQVPMRCVIVRKEHADWQTARYASGGYWVEETFAKMIERVN